MLFRSKNINDLRVNIGLVFQYPEEQFFNMNIYDEISFGMNCFGFKKEDINKRVEESLKMVGLNAEYMYKNPFNISSGEKRKVAIASILAYNPELIILDEPTIGLDSKSKKKLMQIIRMLKTRYKKTVIIVSHDTDRKSGVEGKSVSVSDAFDGV